MCFVTHTPLHTQLLCEAKEALCKLQCYSHLCVQEPLRELPFLSLAGVGDRTEESSGIRWIPRAPLWVI